MNTFSFLIGTFYIYETCEYLNCMHIYPKTYFSNVQYKFIFLDIWSKFISKFFSEFKCIIFTKRATNINIVLSVYTPTLSISSVLNKHSIEWSEQKLHTITILNIVTITLKFARNLKKKFCPPYLNYFTGYELPNIASIPSFTQFNSFSKKLHSSIHSLFHFIGMSRV